MTKLNTSMFDEKENKPSFEKFLDSLNEDLGKLRDKMALQAVPMLIDDMKWLKRNFIIFLIFQAVFNIGLVMFIMLK